MMTRYKLMWVHHFLGEGWELEEHPEGEYVRWEDVEPLLKDVSRLAVLEACGVDNWDGYDYAINIMESR